MAKVDIILEEENADLRSNEISFNLTLKNNGSTATEIYSINPRVPKGADLREIQRPLHESNRRLHEKMCLELTQLVNHILLTSNESIRKQRADIARDAVSSLDSSSKNIFERILNGISPFSLFYEIIKAAVSTEFLENKQKSMAFQEEISTATQGRDCLDRWFKNVKPENEAIKLLFESKLKRLEEIERLTPDDLKILATIEPDSQLTQVYVVRFDRHPVDPRKYSISFDVEFSDAGSQNPVKIIGSASRSVVISPKPLILSYFAAGSALLGAFIKIAVDGGSSFVHLIQIPTLGSPTNDILTYLLQVLVSAILAVVFFNIYEFTEIGKKIGISVGWRGALLIGVLTGLLTDRVLKAISAFIGESG